MTNSNDRDLDALFAEVLETIELAQDLRRGGGKPKEKLAAALYQKLSYDHNPYDFKAALDEFHEEFEEEKSRLVAKIRTGATTREELKAALEANPGDSSFLREIHKSKIEIEEYRTNFEDLDDEAAELGEALLRWVTLSNRIRVQHDVVTLVERGIYAEDVQAALLCWEQHKNSPDGAKESFWQNELASRRGVLQRTLGGNLCLLYEQGHVGNHGLDGKGERITDFVLQHDTTKDVVLVEIKTPLTNLLGKEYRKGVFAFSDELSGAISQVLIQRNELLKNYYQKVCVSKTKFEAHAPRCVLIAGNIDSEFGADNEKLRSFELQRQALNSHVTILSFDELYKQFASFNLGE